MRIEGTYTYSATSARVFGALTEPEALTRLLPGCKRLIQLGPTDANGAVSFEARLSQGDATTTVTLTIIATRPPAHLRVELRGAGPWGPFSGRGSLDLVEQEEQERTLLAYAWDVVMEEQTPGRQRDAQQFARALCERLGVNLSAQESEVEDLAAYALPDQTQDISLAEALADIPSGVTFAVKTSRGAIVALPPSSPGERALISRVWAQRLLWMGTGLAVGIGALALSAGVVRWLSTHHDAA